MAGSIRVVAVGLFLTCVMPAAAASADPLRLAWPQPGGPGTEVTITYSYSNLLDGTFLLLTPSALRSATEEAMGLWARYAPIHFIEQPDSGPTPGDVQYGADATPQIRIGYHTTGDLAHAFFPAADGGLAGDIHLDSGGAWKLDGGWNFLEVITHELGHSLGLPHELERDAIMNPFAPQPRFAGLGSSFLLPADIEALRDAYGSGVGSVTPLDPVPEPESITLVALGLGLLTGLRPGRRTAKTGTKSAIR